MTDVQLVILGEGPERTRLEELIREQDLATAVHLKGWVSNPYPYYRAADAFALSSDFEGMPNVILEALAFDLPVVSTDCPSGPREILTSPDLGYLVPCGNEISFAAALIQALRQKKVGTRRAHVMRRFGAAEVVSQYDEVIFND